MQKIHNYSQICITYIALREGGGAQKTVKPEWEPRDRREYTFRILTVGIDCHLILAV